jgi:hypothetical protein
VTGNWSKLYDEELHSFNLRQMYDNDQIKKYEMDRTAQTWER